MTAVAAVAIVAGTGFAFVNRAPSAEAVAAAHAQSVKQNEEAIADSLAEALAKTTIDIASQVVSSTKDKVDASALAAQAGTVKAANVVMLGAMASALPFTPEMLESVVRKSVPPKAVDVNLAAFKLGLEVAAPA